MASSTPHLLLAFAAGMALGAFFSLHLWRTVQRMTEPAGHTVVAALGFLLRVAVVVAGFSLVMGGRWERLLSALLGFVLVREVMVRYLIRRPKDLARG